MKLLTALAVTDVILLPVRASAQIGTPAPSSKTTLSGDPNTMPLPIKGHLVFWGGGGLDLDVLGNITNGSLGTIRGTQMLIDTTAFPDVYVKTPRRYSAGVGIGFAEHWELFGRYSQTNTPASTILIGRFGSNDNLFAVSFDNYKEQTVEVGLRKYNGSSRHFRQYLQIEGGMKRVQPINVNLQAPGGAVAARLYGQSRMPTAGIDFGVMFEWRHTGLFIEAGGRWQRRLTGDDTDLLGYGLDSINDTGIRLYMPVTTGLYFRF